MLDRARIVIIGAGAVGCTIAYHLSKRGENDVLVRAAGLEPALPKGNKILSLACLPIPPRPHGRHPIVGSGCPQVSKNPIGAIFENSMWPYVLTLFMVLL